MEVSFKGVNQAVAEDPNLRLQECLDEACSTINFTRLLADKKLSFSKER